MGIDCTECPDGTFKIDNYSGIVDGKSYSLSDLGIDENKLMENISVILCGMDLSGSMLTSAVKLRKVGKRIYFSDSKISDLRNLEILNGNDVFWDK